MKPRVSVDCTVGQGQEIWALLQDSDHTGICGGEEIFTNPNWSGMQQSEICSKQNGIQLAYIVFQAVGRLQSSLRLEYRLYEGFN